jgi:hypothetical protein
MTGDFFVTSGRGQEESTKVGTTLTSRTSIMTSRMWIMNIAEMDHDIADVDHDIAGLNADVVDLNDHRSFDDGSITRD